MAKKPNKIRRSWLSELKQSIFNSKKMNKGSIYLFASLIPIHELNILFVYCRKKRSCSICAHKKYSTKVRSMEFRQAMDTEVDVNYPNIEDGFTLFMMPTSYYTSDMFQCFDTLLRRDEINVCLQDGKCINALHCLFLYNRKANKSLLTSLHN